VLLLANLSRSHILPHKKIAMKIKEFVGKAICSALCGRRKFEQFSFHQETATLDLIFNSQKASEQKRIYVRLLCITYHFVK